MAIDSISSKMRLCYCPGFPLTFTSVFDKFIPITSSVLSSFMPGHFVTTCWWHLLCTTHVQTERDKTMQLFQQVHSHFLFTKATTRKFASWENQLHHLWRKGDIPFVRPCLMNIQSCHTRVKTKFCVFNRFPVFCPKVIFIPLPPSTERYYW